MPEDFHDYLQDSSNSLQSFGFMVNFPNIIFFSLEKSCSVSAPEKSRKFSHSPKWHPDFFPFMLLCPVQG